MIGERSLKSYELQEGMVLSRDLMSPTGLLLLTSGHDDAVVRKITNFEKSIEMKLTVHAGVSPDAGKDLTWLNQRTCSMKPKTAHFFREHRLLNLYSALSACDSAIIRKSSRADLFDEICRNIVEMCDMDLVWIGLLEGPDPHIRPVAHCGQGWSYLSGSS